MVMGAGTLAPPAAAAVAPPLDDERLLTDGSLAPAREFVVVVVFVIGGGSRSCSGARPGSEKKTSPISVGVEAPLDGRALKLGTCAAATRGVCSSLPGDARCPSIV